MKKLFTTIALTITLALPGLASAQQKGFGLTLSCPAVPMVTAVLLSNHISYMAEDDKLADRVAKVYAESIDPTRSLLTQSEYDALEKRLKKITRNVRQGQCDDLMKLKHDHVKWQKELEEFVRAEMKKDFKLDETLELEVDIEKRKRPTNDREQATLRRQLIHFQMANYLAAKTELKEAKEKLVHRYELFTRRVEERDQKEVFRIFLNAYATSLDPHSTYLSPDDLADFKIQMELSLHGIGAVLSSRDGYTIVQEIVPGGAADRHGKLRPKDKVIAVAQGKEGEPVDVIDMSLRDVVKKIRGKKGTFVRLTLLRPGGDTERMEITIERDKIDLKEQAAKLHWREVERGKKKLKIAVLELPSFYAGQGKDARDSYVDVAKLIAEAREKKADGMVLDLSRNGGGALQTAVKISGLFIERGPIVGVGSKMKQADPDVMNDRDPRVQWSGPLVVVTSSVSASASEILAGALQDYGRAVVVGDPSTYGKGTVQQLTPLPPGLGVVKVTTALFFLPAGESTQHQGVPSDIVIPSPLANLDIGERHMDYALDPVTTRGFLTAQANASKKWKPVDKKLINELTKRSEKRVAESEEFKELAEDMKERDPDDTTISIAEIMKENGGDSDSEEEKEDEEKELSLQVREAVEIMADQIEVQK